MGVEAYDVCCTPGCGICGGSGCSRRGFGLTGQDCCVGQIIDADKNCTAVDDAPCVLGELSVYNGLHIKLLEVNYELFFVCNFFWSSIRMQPDQVQHNCGVSYSVIA